jgi:hypothetical protein
MQQSRESMVRRTILILIIKQFNSNFCTDLLRKERKLGLKNLSDLKFLKAPIGEV